MSPRDESGDLQAQMRSLIDELNAHLIEDAARDARDKKRDEILERIESKCDLLTTKWNEFQGMGKLAKAIFFGIGPIVGAALWIKEHFKW
jgi:hypothetical protein